jgi:hypothetical protein
MNDWPNTRFEYVYEGADDESGHLYAKDRTEAMERLVPVLENIHGSVDRSDITLAAE